MSTSNINISVVIPLFNEQESIKELVQWIDDVTSKHNYTYEVFLVDDGSSDDSWQVVQQICESNKSARGIKFKRNYGKSAALNTGFEHAVGEVVITMDADLQDSPEEIPELYTMIKDDGYDLVSGWKQKRHDPLMKTIPTKIFNAVTRRMSGIKLNDFNCGLKAYSYELVKSIEVYGEMHRYIPVIAKWTGFTKIGEKVVQHKKRKYGASKYGLERFINGFLDLLSITFVSRFKKKPMHFFGLLGTIMFVIGFGMSVWIGAWKLYSLSLGAKARLITDQPLFYIALVAMILGTQLFLAGFLAEMISRNSNDRNNYIVEKRILNQD